MLAELTISYETNFEVAAERKEEKYNWSPEPSCNAGCETELITLFVAGRVSVKVNDHMAVGASQALAWLAVPHLKAHPMAA